MSHIVSLPRKRIDELFEGAEHQAEPLIALYRIALPNWDDIESLDGYPAVSDTTWKHISRKFMELDRIHHPDCLQGGA